VPVQLMVTPVPDVPALWRLSGETNGYLIVRGAESLLIDCPAGIWAPLLEAAGLPLPRTILHTQVQDEHCGEWAAFPTAQVLVAKASLTVAQRTQKYFEECATVWPPSRAWETLGEEKFGIGGCTTERPPAQPLQVIGTLQSGHKFQWQDVTFEIFALPASGKRSIGLAWRDKHVIFSGDLLLAGGYLVNAYDLERNYGMPLGYVQLQRNLRQVAAMNPRLLLPTTGPIITEPIADIDRLKKRIAWATRPPALRRHEPAALINYLPARVFGRFREVLPGLYQNTNYGNVIVFVTANGAGLLIDPGPCIWPTWEEGAAGMQEDLDLLEREAGLTRIERALITHFHGDHVQFCDLLRQRYGTEILATPDVATLLAHPETYHYPCCVDWYGYPYKCLTVDRVIVYEQPLTWQDTTITPVHAPGHCYAHAAFLLDWHHRRTACTGDVLQYGAGPISVGMPILYNDTAWPDRGLLVTLARLAAYQPEVVLCGHSQSFLDPDGAILADWQLAAGTSLALAHAMAPDGDLLRMMTPPGFDIMRQQLMADTRLR